MATLQAAESFQGGTNGANVSTTNTTFSSMSVGTAANLIHSNDFALPGLARSMKAQNSGFQWGNFDLASHTRHRHRLSVYVPANPPAAVRDIFYEVEVGSNATIAFQVTMKDANIDIRNVNTVVGTAHVMPLGQWVDIEIDADGAADLSIWVYTGATQFSTNHADAAFTITGALTATNFGRTEFGKTATVTGGHTLYYGYSSNITDSAAPTPYSAPAPASDDGNVRISRLVANVNTEFEFLRRVAGSPVLFALDRKNVATAGSFSSILVPSVGCLVGAETPNVAVGSAGATLAGLQAYESFAVKTPDILHFYKTGQWTGVVSASENAQVNRAGKRRPLLMYNWKVPGTWADVAAGLSDADIDRAAAGIRNWAHKGFLTIYHEPEDNVGGTGMSAANYVSMYDHVVTRLRAQGVGRADQGGKCVFVLNLMGYKSWKTLIPTLIPNTSNFDWGGWDPYAFVQGGVPMTTAQWMNDTATGWAGFYAWWMANYPSKPLILPEWGVQHNGAAGFSQGQEATFYANLPANMAASFPNVRAMILWNSDTEAANGYNYRINGRATAEAAWRTMVADPYFSSVSTDDAP